MKNTKHKDYQIGKICYKVESIFPNKDSALTIYEILLKFIENIETNKKIAPLHNQEKKNKI